MPITLLFDLGILLIMILLIINVVYPLLVPNKYKLFFMFRKDKFKQAEAELEEFKRKAELDKLKEEMKKNQSKEKK